MRRQQSRAVTFALVATTALVLSLLAAYASGLFGSIPIGYVSMGLGALWLLLTVFAGVSLADEVLSGQVSRRAARIAAGLLALAAIPVVHALLPGPDLSKLAFRIGFRQHLESQVPPKELHQAVAALLANRRAEGKQLVLYRSKAELSRLPKAVRRLQPAEVAVNVPANTVRLRWGQALTSWQLVVTTGTMRFESDERD